MPDIALRSATDLARAIRQREISSRELLDHYAARIERIDRQLNAVISLDLDRARRRAGEADAALARGECWGPLHGVPMTIKETFEVEGTRTTAGFSRLADHVSTRNAIAVDRLLAAGAVIFGKTNVPVLAGDVQSYNPIYGLTKNPWDAERTCGGSSGGAAVALAAGFTGLELGSDIGGSIRTPAGWCGVYGHKPSHGVVPQRGHVPGPPGALAEVDLGVMGPMARDAADLHLILDAIAGPTPERAIAFQLRLPPPRRSALRDYRVAAWLDDPSYPLDADVRRCLGEAIDALRRHGVAVDDAARPAPSLRPLVRDYTQLLTPIMTAGLPPEQFEGLVALAASLAPDDESPLAWTARFAVQRHREWLAANEAREQTAARFADFFRRFDVLLLPITCVPAIPHDHSEPFPMRTIALNGETRPYADLFSWIAPATLTRAPATAAPVGFTPGGLPVGIQVVGPYLEDHTAIDFAARLAEVVGGFVAPPLA